MRLVPQAAWSHRGVPAIEVKRYWSNFRLKSHSRGGGLGGLGYRAGPRSSGPVFVVVVLVVLVVLV